ncbi:MAG: hypothetical protein LC776_01070 [Acidobacteria bacterium]|nr:hypothetical protein [Acidobacteriota bacterium]
MIAEMLAAILNASAEQWKDALTALAIMIGGLWTLYQFVLRKAFESALRIGIDVRVAQSAGPLRLVTIGVTFENKGQRRITAPPKLSSERIADYEGSITHPADLQLKQLAAGAAPSFIGWWKAGSMNDIPGVPEHVSLLFEYSRKDGLIDFFLELGEVYEFQPAFHLFPGDYAAKIVFAGRRATAAEFWSRIVFFQVT